MIMDHLLKTKTNVVNLFCHNPTWDPTVSKSDHVIFFIKNKLFLRQPSQFMYFL